MATKVIKLHEAFDVRQGKEKVLVRKFSENERWHLLGVLDTGMSVSEQRRRSIFQIGGGGGGGGGKS